MNRGTLFAGTCQTGMFSSTDNGDHWGATELTKGDVTSFAVSGRCLFAGTSNGIYTSTDNGRCWTPTNSGLSDPYITSLAVGEKYLFAGTRADGVWRRRLSEMIASAELAMSQLPGECVLHQNYPNPFNPSTTIRYGLLSRSHVTLTVFNTLGQQVATLVEGEVEAEYHEVRFDASGLASGVYLYRLAVGSFVETRKLVLVR